MSSMDAVFAWLEREGVSPSVKINRWPSGDWGITHESIDDVSGGVVRLLRGMGPTIEDAAAAFLLALDEANTVVFMWHYESFRRQLTPPGGEA